MKKTLLSASLLVSSLPVVAASVCYEPVKSSAVSYSVSHGEKKGDITYNVNVDFEKCTLSVLDWDRVSKVVHCNRDNHLVVYSELQAASGLYSLRKLNNGDVVMMFDRLGDGQFDTLSIQVMKKAKKGAICSSEEW